MGTTAGLVTVAEFERMQDPKDGSRLELHHGEVVTVPPPKSDYAELQDRMLDALRAIARSEWKIRTELAFRPKAEHEVWSADVGVMGVERWENARRQKAYPLGAPELVVEVLSPSNTASEMYDRERTCFDAGCREFWIVDPDTRQIHVTSPDGPSRTYRSGEKIPVALLGGAMIEVDQIFQDQ
jgi:Uma2 family endonuclease